jgi:hypothetical protein
MVRPLAFGVARTSAHAAGPGITHLGLGEQLPKGWRRFGQKSLQASSPPLRSLTAPSQARRAEWVTCQRRRESKQVADAREPQSGRSPSPPQQASPSSSPSPGRGIPPPARRRPPRRRPACRTRREARPPSARAAPSSAAVRSHRRRAGALRLPVRPRERDRLVHRAIGGGGCVLPAHRRRAARRPPRRPRPAAPVAAVRRDGRAPLRHAPDGRVRRAPRLHAPPRPVRPHLGRGRARTGRLGVPSVLGRARHRRARAARGGRDLEPVPETSRTRALAADPLPHVRGLGGCDRSRDRSRD